MRRHLASVSVCLVCLYVCVSKCVSMCVCARTLDGGGVDVGVLGGGVVAPDDGAGHVLFLFCNG